MLLHPGSTGWNVANQFQRHVKRSMHASACLQVDRLMYQINSDSEGGEGSDIVPEEHDGSQSDDASGSDNGDTPDMDGVDPRGEHTEAAGVGQHGTETASFPHPDPGKGDTTPLPKPQESSATASQAQDSADSHGDGGEETALEMQALEQTLPYEAGPTSLPSQQTLLYHVASSTQLSDTSHAQQAGSTMVNQMHPQDAQTVPQTAGLHATAAQEHASAQQGVRAVPTAATMVSSPMQGPNLGSPMSPVLGSAKKQKQADIRAFLSPKAMRR